MRAANGENPHTAVSPVTGGPALILERFLFKIVGSRFRRRSNKLPTRLIGPITAKSPRSANEPRHVRLGAGGKTSHADGAPQSEPLHKTTENSAGVFYQSPVNTPPRGGRRVRAHPARRRGGCSSGGGDVFLSLAQNPAAFLARQRCIDPPQAGSPAGERPDETEAAAAPRRTASFHGPPGNSGRSTCLRAQPRKASSP